MKQRVLALLASALLLLPGCGPSYRSAELTANRAPAVPPAAADLSGPGAQAAADFAVRLFLETDSGTGNTLLSPLSVLAALAMTAGGAAGETRAQMEAVLGMPAEDWSAYFRSCLAALPAQGEAACRMANSVWFRDEGERLAVREDFLANAAENYQASVFAAPFDGGTLRDINAWVSDRTAGRIPSILDQISPTAMLYLINALAFDGAWETPYQGEQLRTGTFTAWDGTGQNAELMFSREEVFLDDGRATGFLKYYQGRSYAFAALLPKEGLSLEDYLADLTGEGLHAALSSAQEAAVETALPQFTCQGSISLRSSLAALGMPDAFDVHTADFSAMGASSDGPLFISQVLHKTFLSVDAQGTKAAAATLVAMDSGAAAPAREVILNRPFVYLLIDCEARLPLFLGVVRTLEGG